MQSEVSMVKVSPKFPSNIKAYVTVQRGIVHKRETKSRLKCKRTGRQRERTRMNTSIQVSVYVNSSVLSLVVTDHSLPIPIDDRCDGILGENDLHQFLQSRIARSSPLCVWFGRTHRAQEMEQRNSHDVFQHEATDTNCL